MQVGARKTPREIPFVVLLQSSASSFHDLPHAHAAEHEQHLAMHADGVEQVTRIDLCASETRLGHVRSTEHDLKRSIHAQRAPPTVLRPEDRVRLTHEGTVTSTTDKIGGSLRAASADNSSAAHRSRCDSHLACAPLVTAELATVDNNVYGFVYETSEPESLASSFAQVDMGRVSVRPVDRLDRDPLFLPVGCASALPSVRVEGGSGPASSRTVARRVPCCPNRRSV